MSQMPQNPSLATPLPLPLPCPHCTHAGAAHFFFNAGDVHENGTVKAHGSGADLWLDITMTPCNGFEVSLENVAGLSHDYGGIEKVPLPQVGHLTIISFVIIYFSLGCLKPVVCRPLQKRRGRLMHVHPPLGKSTPAIPGGSPKGT